MSSFTVERCTAAHRDRLLALFDACGSGCYCRFWHFDGDDNAWQLRCATEPDENRRAFASACSGDEEQAQGVVALAGDEVVGWLKLPWAASVPKVFGRRLYRSLTCFEGDRSRVLIVGCLLVHPAHRRRGVASALIGGAIEAGRELGAQAIEALPRRPPEPVSDEALWLGPASSYLAHGFRQIGGMDGYPVLRLDL